MGQEPIYHIPALLDECMDGLHISPSGIYVDATFGGGGHSGAILSRLDTGHLYAFDQDTDAEKNRFRDNKFTFVRSNFKFLKNFLRYHQVDEIDGLLADLGVSFHHFDDARRGFSFRFDARLDMRMNNRGGKSGADILNEYTEERLADIFYLYGELKAARKIAAAIVRSRNTAPITDTARLLETVRPFIDRKQEKKELAQLFQALRIEVNQEMDSLKKLLTQATECLRPGGRLVILTYHSLEDRLVKNYFKTGNFEGKPDVDFFGRINAPLKPVNHKIITPSKEEMETNPRSRSAKLRIAEKV
ncbi:MAG: 16S rRNA (cytosine(1402)-N(4))-methyltransferase RsmH [Coprobacter sp.]|nr:16S rRNA (cytosine(1402)-N(4))-methyltransferase RsmH [Coprobacter sp.]